MPLALLLGSRSAPVSIAVCQLWSARAVNDASLSDVASFAEVINPPAVSALLNLAFSLVVYMVDVVKAFTDNGEGDGVDTALQNLTNTPIAVIQNTLDSFLTNWFAEQMCGEKADAVSFSSNAKTMANGLC